jgi:hypothetical protein
VVKNGARQASPGVYYILIVMIVFYAKDPDMQMKILVLLSLFFIFFGNFAKATIFVGKTNNTNILHYWCNQNCQTMQSCCTRNEGVLFQQNQILVFRRILSVHFTKYLTKIRKFDSSTN